MYYVIIIIIIITMAYQNIIRYVVLSRLRFYLVRPNNTAEFPFDVLSVINVITTTCEVES